MIICMHSLVHDIIIITAKPNNEIMSSAAQQGSVQPQETHHHHNNISYNLHISLNVAADSALHRAEEFLLDTDNFDSKLLKM